MTSLIPFSFLDLSCIEIKTEERLAEMQWNEMGSLILLVKCKNRKLKRQELSDINFASDVLLL